MVRKLGAARVGAAGLVGLGIGAVDASSGYDATGLTALAVLVATGGFGLARPERPWRWALAVGVWVPVLNMAEHRNYGSLLALAFAFAGAYAGAGISKVPGAPANEDRPSEGYLPGLASP